jgi:hypothetical protein
MTMPVDMKRLIHVFAFALTLMLPAIPAFSQVSGGRAALAAKQHLKTALVDAMADGKISVVERADILSEAKETLTVKEYETLKSTMDRLSPVEKKSTAVAKRAPKDKAMVASATEKSSPTFFGQMLSRVPYMDDFSSGPRPELTKTPASIPYIKTSDPYVAPSQKALAKTTPKDTYLEMPVGDRVLPKITRVERVSTARRPDSKSEPLSKKTVTRKPVPAKYADESVLPMPPEPESPEPSIVLKPKKSRQTSTEPSDSTALATPDGALLPDSRSSLIPTGYSKPMQPESMEREFQR